MNKLILALGLIIASAISYRIAYAQNTPTAPATYNGSMGTAGFGLNAPGANYGLIGNDSTQNSGNGWSLGYGASLSGAVTPVFSWDSTPAAYARVPFVLSKTIQGAVSGGAAGQGIFASTTIVVLSSYETILSSGGNIKFTSLPTIATATTVGGTTAFPDGTLLVITSTDSKVLTFQSNGALSGSQLFLGASTRAVSSHKVLGLRYNGTTNSWDELYYTDGNN